MLGANAGPVTEGTPCGKILMSGSGVTGQCRMMTTLSRLRHRDGSVRLCLRFHWADGLPYWYACLRRVIEHQAPSSTRLSFEDCTTSEDGAF